eukprot:gene9444-biopygen3219
MEDPPWPGTGHLAACGPGPGGLGRPRWPAKITKFISSDTGKRKKWQVERRLRFRHTELKNPLRGEDSCGPPLGQLYPGCLEPVCGGTRASKHANTLEQVLPECPRVNWQHTILKSKKRTCRWACVRACVRARACTRARVRARGCLS